MQDNRKNKKNSPNSGKYPNMRFPEFDGEWEEILLGSAGDFIGGGTPSTSNIDFWMGDIPWLSSSDLEESNIFKINVSKYINLNSIENSATKLCAAPSILIVSRVGVGKIAFSNIDVCTSQDFTNIINLKYDGVFLSYLLSIILKRKSKEAQGTSIKGITSFEIKSIKLKLPKTKEQQKIATFLSLIDKRIEVSSKIIAHTETLIQNLNNLLKEKYGNDIEINLNSLGNFYSGLSGKNADDFGDGKPFITYLNVFNNNIISDEEFGYVKIDENEKQNAVKYGDALFTISSETPEEVGISAVYLGNEKELYLNSFCLGFRLDNFNTLLPEYLPYLFSSQSFRKFIFPFAQGSTRYNLSRTDLMKRKFCIPDIENQRKIATLLSNLSNKLKIEKTLLLSYKQQKSFLLQNMFI